jgi:hypothetical protein
MTNYIYIYIVYSDFQFVKLPVIVPVYWQSWSGIGEAAAVPTSRGYHNAGLQKQHFRLYLWFRL